jgi:uncharacterized radical SAM protein YgiQ
MDQLGWDSCDIILVTGDAYVDHPSFGMAICGRMLEAQGFAWGSFPSRTGTIKTTLCAWANLFFGVTAGNMDSMINRYTADRKLRHDDAYTAGNVAGKRPDRATLVYTQRCKEAWKDVPVILGGIEASLRRTAHYDYWSDTVRRSVLVDSKADMLMFGNGERPLVEVAHRLAAGAIDRATQHRHHGERGAAGLERRGFHASGYAGKIDPIPHPYGEDLPCADNKTAPPKQEAKRVTVQPPRPKPWEKTYVLLPSFEKVKGDKVSTRTRRVFCTMKPTPAAPAR